jgi:SAM-dependent methyltransferase
MDLKVKYAENHSKETQNTLYLNERLFDTYNRVISEKLDKNLSGKNIDLGSGDKGFSKYLETINIISYPYDYPDFNIEKDEIPHSDNSIDFVTMNAVIEHIQDPSNIFKEIFRVLKPQGVVLVRTPNWKMSFKDFYDDPTHVKPYSPSTLKQTLEFCDLETIFLEPGLIEKSWFWWRLPETIKWFVASQINGGTKSILGVGYKR